MVDAAGNPAALWLDDMEALVPGSVTTVKHPNSFDQHGLSGDLPHLEAKLFNQAICRPSATFDAAKVFLADTNKAVTGTLADNRSRQTSSFRDIKEDTMAFYATADMSFGDNISAVLGARMVKTDIESTSFNDHDGDENTADILTTKTNSYDDLLPSLNVSYELAEDTKLRFAAARYASGQLLKPECGFGHQWQLCCW